MNRPFIIHHGEDPDGIIAASILTEYCFRQGIDTAQCFPVRYDTLSEEFPNILEAARKEQPQRILVADVNAQQALVRSNILSGLAATVYPLSGEKSITWIDHHPATDQHREDLEQQGISVVHHSQRCAALLGLRYAGLKDDPYFHQLAAIAQAHDYAKPGKTNRLLSAGNQLEEIIALANAVGDEDLLRRLVADLQHNRYFDDNSLAEPWQSWLGESQKQRKKAFRDLEDSLVRETIGDYTVLFAFAPPILSQKPAPRYLQEKYGAEIDLVFCLFAAPFRNHMIFGRKDVSFDVVGFCQQMGGGGRNNGGGFTRDSVITNAEYPAVREEMKERMAQYLQEKG
ncbi:hypothetical protein HY495_00675 [Candidatus Woesearchaeota archaeon]|nr:hypothetical protein [Candidatus Woesearchaeota archaeon]